MYEHEKKELQKQLTDHLAVTNALFYLSVMFLGAALMGFGSDIVRMKLTNSSIVSTVLLMFTLGCSQWANTIVNDKIDPIFKKLHPEKTKEKK